MARALGALLCAVVAAEADVPARGTRQRLRGATREIGDVATELEHVESLEHRVEQDPVCKSNLQPDFNVRVFECFDTSTSAVLRELAESNRFVQKSAESTSI